MKRVGRNVGLSERSLSTSTGGLKAEYEFIKAERKDGAGLITLDRPKALNALCDGLLDDLIHAARVFDKDDHVGAIVITGSKKAFAAGADIKEMSTRNYIECYTNNLFENWADVTKITKPVSFDESCVDMRGVWAVLRLHQFVRRSMPLSTTVSNIFLRVSPSLLHMI